jgi:hypothetical protein
MDNLKNAPLNHSQIKKRPIFLKILMCFVVIVLEMIASKPVPRRPTLQEEMMGEKLPFSDEYYIPDDHN